MTPGHESFVPVARKEGKMPRAGSMTGHCVSDIGLNFTDMAQQPTNCSPQSHDSVSL